MNTLLDDLLVGVLLLISAGYVFSALGPRNLRRRVLAAVGAWLARAPAVLGVRRAARRIAQAAETKPPGACGGCDNCGEEAPSSRSPGTRAPSNRAPGNRAPHAGAATDIKVPMANIGRVRR